MDTLKLRIYSDLHLEFYRYLPEFEIPNPSKNEILCLLGDIAVGTQALDFIQKQCERFQHVIYVLGNHEYYQNDFETLNFFWKNTEMPKNFTFLQDSYLPLEGIDVFGATLWTNVPEEYKDHYFSINDYRLISYGGCPLTVEDTNRFNKHSLNCIETFLQENPNNKKVILTHHSPISTGSHPRFNNSPLNCFFNNSLDMSKYNVDLWAFGHTHYSMDEIIHGTRVYSNPNGYPSEDDVQVKHEVICI